MSAPLTRNAIIVNLASEGVPIAVIARSLQVPSAHVFEVAREALEDGRLLAIPSYDWGKERGPAFKATNLMSRPSTKGGDRLAQGLRGAFKFSAKEAALVAAIARGVKGQAAQELATGTTHATNKVIMVRIRQRLSACGRRDLWPMNVHGDGWIYSREQSAAILSLVENIEGHPGCPDTPATPLAPVQDHSAGEQDDGQVHQARLTRATG
jgi:hypothetical protein